VITIVDHVEMEVSADGHASTPPSGAADGTPPASAAYLLVEKAIAIFS
jgi:hypothetical protein